MSRAFFVVMGCAAGVSLARGFAVAAALGPSGFGAYAAIVAAGAFGSILLSLGQIETSMKTFPRMWAEGRGLSVLHQADSLAMRIGLRAATAPAAAAALLAALDRSEWIAHAFGVAAVAAATAWVSLYASALRATSDLRSLARATAIRAGLALGFATAGAAVLGWAGGIAGEVVAATAAAAWTRQAFVRRERAGHRAVAPVTPPSAASTQVGWWMLGATLAAAAPFYLDRMLVARTLGVEAAGRYALLMLFVLAASTLAGIVAQRVGPELVKAAHAGMAPARQLRTALVWMAGQVAVFGVFVLLAAIALLVGPFDGLGRRFALDVPLLSAAAAIGALQSSVLLDWLLLSRDREQHVFIAAASYLLAALALAAWVILAQPDLAALLLGLLAAKTVHVCVQAVLAVRLAHSPPWQVSRKPAR
jgi:O-antigen/teichoic acid export membrane protein